MLPSIVAGRPLHQFDLLGGAASIQLKPRRKQTLSAARILRIRSNCPSARTRRPRMSATRMNPNAQRDVLKAMAATALAAATGQRESRFCAGAIAARHHSPHH